MAAELARTALEKHRWTGCDFMPGFPAKRVAASGPRFPDCTVPRGVVVQGACAASSPDVEVLSGRSS